MDTAKGGVVLAGVCIGMWMVATALCLSRTPLLLEDRHSPIASPLVMVKVVILVLLVLWALCYAGLGELGLLFSDAYWRIIPACIFHILVLQLLRPMAVMLFCVVISTPASCLQSAVHANARREMSPSNQQADCVAMLPVDTGEKFHVPYLRREGLVGVDFRGTCSVGEELDSVRQSRNLPGVAGEFTHLTDPSCASVTNTEGLELVDSIPLTKCGDIHYSQLSHIINTAKVLGSVDGDSTGRPLPGGWDPSQVKGPVGGKLQQESNGSEVLPVYPVNAKAKASEEVADYNIYSDECSGMHVPPSRRCSRVLSAFGYWLIGRLPPVGVVGMQKDATEQWSRLLLWRVALRMQPLIFVWCMSIGLSSVFVAFLLMDNVRGCMERNSEISVCRTSGMEGLTPPRLHLPRSLSIIALVDNALLLLLWVVCGVECLSHIGNVMTKQSFARTYVMGALVLILHTLYDSVELFDELRYNGLVAVVMLTLRNVCDIVLVVLIALRLGNSNRRMPWWERFSESLWHKVTKTTG
ncbi:hypothetical protein TraAM80_07026 [Trypanosoma rangeli]|uniref:Uncharacterized protein n=1 Tax=Trypanosoma rangeli TaxID=5698 RepID=A0A3R7RF11_TRYRA|nr:uncharacterized protein TraAM80_07026 [Trypanosoma rangeli]RNF01379.1 hypothetical protein TraAM80_07026 [Trypanosoma rangeli]|eukprot:RNF01379.1 hypothetical protein TraAM80_07026 [Trypanosoma rangeli]